MKTYNSYRKQNTLYLHYPYIDYNVNMPFLAHNSVSLFHNFIVFIQRETSDSYLTRILDIHANAAGHHGSVWQCFIEGSPVMSFCDIQPFSCRLQLIPDPHSSMTAVTRYPLSAKTKRKQFDNSLALERSWSNFSIVFFQIGLTNL